MVDSTNYVRDASELLHQLMLTRVLVLDGAMGTMIQREYLQEEDFRGERFKSWPALLRGNNDLLSITQPHLIDTIHRQYLEAGADIIETNSFNATRTSMADYQLSDEAYEINYAAARIARAACDDFSTDEKPRFVAGVLGPTSKTASMSPDVNAPGFRAITFDELAQDYYQSAKALVSGGADILLVETVFDTLNAKAALFAIQTLFEETKRRWPIMISGTISDASGRTLSGQTVEAFYTSVEHVSPLSVGLNCALGPELLRPHVKALADVANCFISVHPNAGLPNEFGEYDLDAEQMADQIQDWLTSKWVNIVGGCCGTTPEHIEKLTQRSLEAHPRLLKKSDGRLWLAGMETCVL